MRDQLDTKWGSTGFVLEALAVNQFDQALNSNEFKTINNLTYQDKAGRTVGELDVIIWNLRENRAVVVYEAAVSDRLHRKAVPSRNQLRRFELALQKHDVAQILHPYDDSWAFTPEQFEQSRFEVLGSQGAIAAGFDAEVDITFAEAEFLQRKLIDWRKARHTSQEPLAE